MYFHVGGMIIFTNNSLPLSAYCYIRSWARGMSLISPTTVPIFVELSGFVSCSQNRSVSPWATSCRPRRISVRPFLYNAFISHHSRYTSYMFRLSSWVNYPNMFWWRVKIVKPLVMSFSPSSSYFPCLGRSTVITILLSNALTLCPSLDVTSFAAMANSLKRIRLRDAVLAATDHSLLSTTSRYILHRIFSVHFLMCFCLFRYCQQTRWSGAQLDSLIIVYTRGI
jgi:hypothetical protein